MDPKVLKNVGSFRRLSLGVWSEPHLQNLKVFWSDLVGSGRIKSVEVIDHSD